MKKIIKNQMHWCKNYYNYNAVMSAWNKRHKVVAKEIGGLSISSKVALHQKKWQVFNKRFSNDTLNTCYSISGIDNINYVPEEIFEGVIEPKLNADAPSFLQHKSFYNRFFPKAGFIEDHFHKIGGLYFDNQHLRVNDENINSMIENLSYPIVVKKSIDTAGGRDVHFVNNKEQLIPVLDMYDDLVVQAILKPHTYFKKFHDFGLNTIRACLYRSVITGEVHLLNTTLRIGRDGNLDNETQGGLVCNLQQDGALNPFVVDKHGNKLLEHPNSKIVFAECEKIPAFNKLKKTAINITESIPYAKIVSLDLAMNEAGEWKLIEVNLEYQTIRFAQYAGHPFFGEYTDEVIKYCS
ncbi:MAG: sugar-transfer associated ATP-grasp domain-containing protein [Cognaticolwellia sp.]